MQSTDNVALWSACLHHYDTLAEVQEEEPWRSVVVQVVGEAPRVLPAASVPVKPLLFFGLATGRAMDIVASRQSGKKARGTLCPKGTVSSSLKLTVAYSGASC